MKTNLVKKLYTQLCDFGLNSHDWIIKPISRQYCEIYNSADPSFKFMGQIERQKWAYIWLHSV